MKSCDLRVILSTCESLDQARKLAHSLLEAKLAACINAIPGVISFYRWAGDNQQSQEVYLVIKTSADNLERTVSHLEQNHPYEAPLVTVIAPDYLNPAYSSWMNGVLAGAKS